MGKPKHKLIREVDTRWNSTFSVLQRLYEPRQPLAASLPSLNTDLMVFSSEEFETINPCVQVLWPIRQATVEMSEEKRVSGSKVIPLVKMLKHHSARQVPQESVPPVPPPDIQDRNLWGLLDSHVEAEQPAPSATSSAIAEVQRYLRDAHLSRVEDPLKHWAEHKPAHPHLFQVDLQDLCTPASSVPCGRVFWKVGEIAS
ncbi:hypothetical protein AOLI_G00091910 [Acnodon oligacanthus]